MRAALVNSLQTCTLMFQSLPSTRCSWPFPPFFLRSRPPHGCVSSHQRSDLTIAVHARWPVAQLAPLLLGPEGTTVRLGVQRSLPAQNGSGSGATHEAVLRSLIIDVQRKRFSPPPEPYSASRPPIVDARRGIGSKETVRSTTANGGTTEGQFTAA